MNRGDGVVFLAMVLILMYAATFLDSVPAWTKDVVGVLLVLYVWYLMLWTVAYGPRGVA